MRPRPQLTRQTAFVSLAAAVAGLVVGVLAGAFRRTSEGLLDVLGSLSAELAHRPVISWLVPALATAAVAALALWIVQRFAPESGGSGVQEIEGALGGSWPLRWRRVIPAKFVGGSLALGSGMALGREGGQGRSSQGDRGTGTGTGTVFAKFALKKTRDRTGDAPGTVFAKFATAPLTRVVAGFHLGHNVTSADFGPKLRGQGKGQKRDRERDRGTGTVFAKFALERRPGKKGTGKGTGTVFAKFAKKAGDGLRKIRKSMGRVLA